MTDTHQAGICSKELNVLEGLGANLYILLTACSSGHFVVSQVGRTVKIKTTKLAAENSLKLVPICIKFSGGETGR